ncbi:hypothetical protein HXX76_014622 [Chlamydomonas incerta]|uniref:BZIP domain-containing protein n=1 Tax=Chlamydomonas incerta TaxID=51695 RepID=A0A835SBH9_CHLIN|nr:hypothetical protein HXX76_014622 [Chlamydomonas incerta]|eukprot:KAG2424238.1 hypothetical protein HXX76_014622 [Chlamydomonas incerta]
MDVDGLDLAALLADGPDSGVGPSLLDDELFSEDLMQFLETIEGQPTATQCHQKLAQQQQQQQPAPVPAPAVPAPVAASPAVAMSPSPSTSSGCSSGVVSAPAPVPTPVAPAAAAVALAALQQAQMQPACAAMLPRLVTTTAAQQMWTAMLQAACTVTPAIAAAQPPLAASVGEAKARAQPAGTSRQGSREDSGDSSDTDHDDDMVDSKGNKSGNKRKAPEVDWRQIEDPAERRRQRRLAKNRVTAARSRERKKAAWGELEERLKSIETENAQLRAMLETFARENTALKAQLLTVAAAGGVPGLNHGQAGKTMDPATVLPVFIAIMLVVSSLLPGDKACALLGSLLPLALIAAMMGAAGSGANANGGGAFDCLYRLMHMLNTLLSKSGRTLQRSVKRMLLARQRYLGAKGMAKLGDAGARLVDQLLTPPPPTSQSAAVDPGLAPGSPSDSDGHNNAPMDVDVAGVPALQAPPTATCAAAVSGTTPAAAAPVAVTSDLQAACSGVVVVVKQEPVC